MMITYRITITTHSQQKTNVMPLITRVTRVRNFFTKARGPFAKRALTRTQRRAHTLISLASLFGFCAVVWWLTAAGLALTASSVNSVAPSSAQKVLEHWHWVLKKLFDASALVWAWLLAWVATLAPIVCLRRLGYALYTQTPLSFIVAQRFLWLGRALIANIVIGFVAGSIAASQIKEYEFGFSLSFWGTVLAVILAYVVADMIREGARAAEENREFV